VWVPVLVLRTISSVLGSKRYFPQHRKTRFEAQLPTTSSSTWGLITSNVDYQPKRTVRTNSEPESWSSRRRSRRRQSRRRVVARCAVGFVMVEEIEFRLKLVLSTSISTEYYFLILSTSTGTEYNFFGTEYQYWYWGPYRRYWVQNAIFPNIVKPNSKQNYLRLRLLSADLLLPTWIINRWLQYVRSGLQYQMWYSVPTNWYPVPDLVHSTYLSQTLFLQTSQNQLHTQQQFLYDSAFYDLPVNCWSKIVI